jgi:hypothetical protein
MEILGNIYGSISQPYHPKGKTYRDAQIGELVHSVMIEHALEYGVAYRGEPVGEKRGEGEISTERQPPCPQGESRNVIMGMTAWRSRNTAPRETPSPPTRRTKCRNGFATLPPVLPQEQPAMVLLLDRALISWSLAMDERGGH